LSALVTDSWLVSRMRRPYWQESPARRAG
jgi:hypothetical protein